MAEPTTTCIVAEDETLLRQALVDHLGVAWPELRILAECEDGASAREALAEHRPDVAFIDIRMPGLTGLEVAAAAAEVSPQTQIAFVTAYDQYAIDAFAVRQWRGRLSRERMRSAEAGGKALTYQFVRAG